MSSRDNNESSFPRQENVPPTPQFAKLLEPPTTALYIPMSKRKNSRGKRKALRDIINFHTVISLEKETDAVQVQATPKRSNRSKSVTHRYELRSSKKQRPNPF